MGMYTLLHLKWITNKDQLYNTGNSAQCYVARLSCGEGLLLRSDGNAGNTLPNTQGKDPSSRAIGFSSLGTSDRAPPTMGTFWALRLQVATAL